MAGRLQDCQTTRSEVLELCRTSQPAHVDCELLADLNSLPFAGGTICAERTAIVKGVVSAHRPPHTSLPSSQRVLTAETLLGARALTFLPSRATVTSVSSV